MKDAHIGLDPVALSVEKFEDCLFEGKRAVEKSTEQPLCGLSLSIVVVWLTCEEARAWHASYGRPEWATSAL